MSLSVCLCVCLSVCVAAPVKQSVASSLWFVIILCLLALLFLVLLIVFLVRYNRGAKYKVFEKEKRHGAKGGRIDEEDQFCEYIRRSALLCFALLTAFCLSLEVNDIL